jgi:Dolichyl-phosphate-mannose-protein mannosyltransferase
MRGSKSVRFLTWSLRLLPAFGLALVLLPRARWVDLLSRWAPDGQVEFLDARLMTILRLGAGTLFVGALVLAQLLSRSAGFEKWVEALRADLERLCRELVRLAGACRHFSRSEKLAFLGVMVVGAGLRLSLLGLPMRHDESKTFFSFVSRSLPEGLSNYYVPNNHVFHTLLSHLSVALLGEAPWAIRLPACLAGILVPLVTYWLGRRLVGHRAALLGAALTAVTPPLVDASSDARGYTLVAACSLVGFLVLAGRSRRAAAWLLGGPFFALALWAVPTALFSYCAFLLWEVQGRRTRLRDLGLGSVWVAGFAALLYLPVFFRSGPRALLANEYVSPLGFGRFLAGLAEFFGAFLRWSTGSSAALALLCGAGLVIGARSPRARRLLAAALGSILLLLVLRQILPPLRVLGPSLPLLTLVVGRGIFAGLARLRRPHSTPVLALGLALVAAVSLSTTEWNDSWQECPEAQRFAAQILAGDPQAVVLTATPVAGPLRYYLMRGAFEPRRLVWVAKPEQGREALQTERPFYLVTRPETFDLDALGVAMTADFELVDAGSTSRLFFGTGRSATQ